MSRIRSKDTTPELRLRQRLHRLGYRYRVNARPEQDLRYTADLIFTRARVAVFVDGCFWHGCPEHFVTPKTRTDFWLAKIDGNSARDRISTHALEEAGWTVVRIWEHVPVEEAVAMVTAAVEQARRGPGSSRT
ncbi:very short patch repair endonuclease [Tessaracoccus lubricantis]|uniref:Very short patch repair endonuclease n=2 Tax=Tessaracoccus lubricantis TaxID=545543 RepID=A0ABP9F1T6_9ACTN